MFDNRVLLKESSGYALLEPIPLLPRVRPPVIPDRVRLDSDDATIYLADVYEGPGLAGVPRGTVKELRVFEFHYTYPNMGGHKHVAVEGGWDVHRILGTVPLDDDGKIVWTLTNDDLPGNWLQDPCGAQVLANGNIVITSYAGGRKDRHAPKLIEVTREKKVVWKYADGQKVGIHHFQIITTKGVRLSGPVKK